MCDKSDYKFDFKYVSIRKENDNSSETKHFYVHDKVKEYAKRHLPSEDIYRIERRKPLKKKRTYSNLLHRNWNK